MALTRPTPPHHPSYHAPALAAGLALVLTVLASPCAAQRLAPSEPAAGCYIGAYIEMDPVVKDDIAAFEALTGKKHASYFRYVGYGRPFPFEWANRVRAAGAMPHIAWEPNEGLEKIRNDAYLQGWAQAAAHFGDPIMLRYASEMNGDWEAYSGDPDLYVEKWRLVYDVIKPVAPNVIMMWCPFATPKSTIPLYYPGDDYVDWVGVNIYSVVHYEGNINKRSVDNVVQHLEFIYNLYADRKPIAIGEYAATHYCVAIKSETVDFAVREMTRLYRSLETRFPRVRMINWFSVNTVDRGLANNNYAVTTNPTVLATYRELISSPHFLSNVVSTPGAVGPAVAFPGLAPPPGAAPPAFPPAGGPVTALPPTAQDRPLAPLSTSVPLALAEHASPPHNGLAIVVRGGEPAMLQGRVTVEAVPGTGLRPARIQLDLNGQMRALSTAPPYSFPLNADRLPPGEHRVRAVARDDVGAVIAEAQAALVVPENLAPSP